MQYKEEKGNTPAAVNLLNGLIARLSGRCGGNGYRTPSRTSPTSGRNTERYILARRVQRPPYCLFGCSTVTRNVRQRTVAVTDAQHSEGHCFRYHGTLTITM